MAQIFGILFAIVLLAEPRDLRALALQRSDGPHGPAQVVDTGELMDIFLKPAYTELQQAMAKPPADRKEWATIYQKAVRLAELENLLFFRAHEDARKPEWAATAARARQAAADVAAAALLGLRTVHRTFARDAVTVKP